jgi:signal-transduction protein with cAMP-binding, CBS, and nucleotidyltransferase domain
MLTDYSTLDVGAPLMDAIQTVMKDGIRSVIVTREGKPVGIITRRDMLCRCFFQKDYVEKTTAGDVMTQPLITIGPNENVLKAYELMMRKGIRRLVVLEDGKIVGRITLEDIKHLASETPITVFYRIGYFLLGVLVTLIVVALTLTL